MDTTINSKVVVGLGYGDEGKGRVVDYLCSLQPNTLVVRFSGGHQVGHTVVNNHYEKRENGKKPIKKTTRHVFSNFGSGTLQGCPTYWSKHCTVEPIGLLNEFEILIEKGITPKLYIDAECPITTPFEIKMNRKLEAINKHGSVGVGFGATIQREEDFYSLKFIDLYYPSVLAAKLDNIRKYYNADISNKLDAWLKACEVLTFFPIIKMVRSTPSYTNYIYEGSQGILLDQHYGFFPNVTRANCGTANLPLMFPETEFYLVTRAYQTRHGNGFMTNENVSHNILCDKNETNVYHSYQGEFRRTVLDLDMLKYAIERDPIIAQAPNKILVITCLDHLSTYTFTENSKMFSFGSESLFIDAISEKLKIKNILLSRKNEGKLNKKF